MSRLTRFARLTPGERRLTALAWGQVALASVRLRFGLDPRSLEGVMPGVATGPARSPSDVDAAVRRASRLVPGARCLAQAMAARAMLRGSGPPAIRYAVGRDVHGDRIEAHAWVEMDGRCVAGDPPGEGWVPLERSDA